MNSKKYISIPNIYKKSELWLIVVKVRHILLAYNGRLKQQAKQFQITPQNGSNHRPVPDSFKTM